MIPILRNPILHSLRFFASQKSHFRMSQEDNPAVPTPLKTASTGSGFPPKSNPPTDASKTPPPGGKTPGTGPGLHPFDDRVLTNVESVIQARWTCRHFDETRPVDGPLIRRLLTTTMRAPTGYNLQPWHAIVVQDAARREALCAAALGQPQVRQAPLTVVFAGDMEAERNAPQVLEMGLESGYMTEDYAPAFLRNVYYFLHGGPLQAMALTKSMLSSYYSRLTSNPLLSVPISMKGYAWKQTMIPATTFVHLCTAAGLNTCIMEGIDEEAMREVVGLPSRFTIPIIVSVGYAVPSPTNEERKPEGEAKSNNRRRSVFSPRFAPEHVIRWEKF
ncbi:unnamed protein product [Phytomonas sp. Hart1]|nr:unnamed protein product [Phytomonas sp. Hart1]|eukprot:CCW69076.1 unnamed protein product [Phytomonas sp. isolate Hart1]